LLERLDDFRGESRFTTWAYKFAVLETAVKLRKRAWQGQELPVSPEAWNLFSSVTFAPDAAVEQGEMLSVIQTAVADVLTPRQRQVLVALVLNGVPIDVVAERLDTTRGALYKTLHDARRKLREKLEKQGFTLA
jgi:RNA polymerase sigma-70 factor (ECF subfamily)